MPTKEKCEETESEMIKYLRSDEGKASMKEYWGKIEADRKQRNKELRDLKKQLKEEGALEKHIKAVVKENKDKVKKCIEENGMPYEKTADGYAEINPIHSFGLLSDYFAKNGKNTHRQFQDTSSSHTIGDYTINTFHGQGVIHHLLKKNRVLLII